MSEQINPDEALRAYWSARSRKRRSASGRWGTVADFFMFRRMVTPWLLRFGFGFFVGFMCFAVVLSVTDAFIAMPGGSSGGTVQPINPLNNVGRAISGKTSAGLNPVAVLISGIVVGLLLLLAVRVVFEMYVVFFQINETLSDIRAALSERERKV